MSKRSHDTTDIQEGGALTTFKSDATLGGTCTPTYNYAKNGRAIHTTESVVHVIGEVTIAYNTAEDTGGGAYLDMSELHCQGNSSLWLLDNVAVKKRGGLHTIRSSTFNR